MPSAVLRYWRASSLAARRQTLLFEVKRDNIDEKVKDFMARSDELVFVLRQQEALAAAAQGWGVTGALALGVVVVREVRHKTKPQLKRHTRRLRNTTGSCSDCDGCQFVHFTSFPVNGSLDIFLELQWYKTVPLPFSFATPSLYPPQK